MNSERITGATIISAGSTNGLAKQDGGRMVNFISSMKSPML